MLRARDKNNVAGFSRRKFRHERIGGGNARNERIPRSSISARVRIETARVSTTFLPWARSDNCRVKVNNYVKAEVICEPALLTTVTRSSLSCFKRRSYTRSQRPQLQLSQPTRRVHATRRSFLFLNAINVHSRARAQPPFLCHSWTFARAKRTRLVYERHASRGFPLQLKGGHRHSTGAEIQLDVVLEHRAANYVKTQ